MPRIFRVEREWVPLKQYLPADIYAEVLKVFQQDIAYSDSLGAARIVGNEAKPNAMIRYMVQIWLKHRKELEDVEGITEYRERLIESKRMLRAISEENEKQDAKSEILHRNEEK